MILTPGQLVWSELYVLFNSIREGEKSWEIVGSMYEASLAFMDVEFHLWYYFLATT